MIYNLKELILKIKEKTSKNKMHHTVIMEKIGINNYKQDFLLIQEIILGNSEENHPDLLRLSASDKGVIKIDEVRDMITFANLKSSNGKNKLIGIFNAENLNNEAENAMLKTIEEPFSETFFFLFTENLNKINETIKSRSVIYKYTNSEFDNNLKIQNIEKVINHLSVKNIEKINILIENGFFKKYEEFISNILQNSQYFSDIKINYQDLIEILNRISYLIIQSLIGNKIDFLNTYEEKLVSKITQKKTETILKYIIDTKKKIIDYRDYNFNESDVLLIIMDDLAKSFLNAW